MLLVWWELGWGCGDAARDGEVTAVSLVPQEQRNLRSPSLLPLYLVLLGLGTRTVCAEDTDGFCHRSLLSGWWNPDTLPYRNRRLAQFPFGVQKSSKQTTGLRFGAKTSGRISESVGAGGAGLPGCSETPTGRDEWGREDPEREGETFPLGGGRRPPKGTLGNVRRHLRLLYLDVWGRGAPGTRWGDQSSSPTACSAQDAHLGASPAPDVSSAERERLRCLCDRWAVAGCVFPPVRTKAPRLSHRRSPG